MNPKIMSVFVRTKILLQTIIFCCALNSAMTASKEAVKKPAVKNIQLFYTQDSTWDSQTRDVLHDRLKQTHPNITVNLHNIKGLNKHRVALLLPKEGSCALSFDRDSALLILASRRKTPYLLLGLSQQTLERLHHNYQRLGVRVSGVYSTPSIEQQVRLIQAALPETKNVGIFFDQFDINYRSVFQSEIENKGLHFNPLYMEAHEHPATMLTLFKTKPDVILLTESIAMNRDKLNGLVLKSFQAGIPLAGATKGQVKAGALFGYDYPEKQMITDAMALVNNTCLSGHDSQLSWPNTDKVLINKQVAANLGLEQLDEDSIQNRLQR